MTLSDIGFLASDISSLVPVAIGIYFYKRLRNDRRILLYFFIYGSLVELTNAWMAMHGEHNTWSINIYKLIEYSVFVLTFNRWSREIFVRWLSLVGSVIFYALWFGYVAMKGISANNEAAELTESIILMLLSGFVLTSLGIKTEFPVFRNYRFWFAGASFIYFSVNIVLAYIFSLIVTGHGFDTGIWSIHTVLNIIVYFLFARAFFLPET